MGRTIWLRSIIVTRWISRSLFAIIILLLLAFIFSLTPTGFHLSIKFAQEFLPGQLTYKKISGNIFGPINISDLEYDSKTLHFSAEYAHLEWRLPMLLLGKLDIADFRANKIKIINKTVLESNLTTPPEPKKLKLPLSLFIEKANIYDITYVQPHTDTNFDIKRVLLRHVTLSKQKVRGLVIINLRKPYLVNNTILLDGKLSNYHFTWTLEKNKQKVILTGKGNKRNAFVSMNSNHLLDGSGSANFLVAWYPQVRWQALIKLKNINLKKIDPMLPKIDRASINSDGTWKDTIPDFNISANVEMKNSVIALQGYHEKTWNLNWNIDLYKIDQLIDGYQGSLHSKGTIKGDSHRPTITLEFNANNLLTHDYSIQQLSGIAALDLLWEIPAKISFTGKNINTPTLQAKLLSATFSADKNLHQMDGSLQFSNETIRKLTLSTQLKGGLNERNWQGKITQLNISGNGSESWHLTEPSAAELSLSNANISQTCLTSDIGNTCFDFTWDNQHVWKINSNGKLKNLSFLTKMLSRYLTADSPATFNFSATGVDAKIHSVTASFNTTAGTLNYLSDFERLSIPYKQLIFTAKTANNQLVTHLKLEIAKDNFIETAITLHKLDTLLTKLDKSTIEGNVRFHVSELKMLQFFIPYISKPTGIIQGDLLVSGTLSNPSLQGKLGLVDGGVDIPMFKVQLKNLLLSVGAHDHTLSYTFSGKSGELAITAEGTTVLGKEIVTKINIRGKDVLVVNTPEYTVYATPDLVLNVTGHTPSLSGTILIPKATIKPADFSSTITLPDEIIIIGKGEKSKQIPWNWLMDLTISLGDEVVLDTHGLQGKLNGKLHIQRRIDQENAVATGELHITDGKLITQGKELKLSSSSSISYSHDLLNNPHLNIRAFRTVSVLSSSSLSPVGPTQAQVGVAIKGTVKHPNVTMFSSPVTLSQADILSYLLFNQPASGSSSANLSLILQAVQSLKLSSKSEDSSLNQIQQSLGITELGVQQQLSVDALGTPLGINQSAFVIGKYLTPNIYLRYNHGLLTSVDIYEIRYIINKNWAVQTNIGSNSDVGSGMDILYSIGRKKFPW